MIVQSVERTPARIVEGFRELDSATIGHMWHQIRFEVLDSEIRPVDETLKVVGPAVTVRIPVIDNILCHKAIEVAQPGDVLVIDAQGNKKYACWGGNTSLSAKIRGIAGVVVDGAICDILEIRQMVFPVFARAVTPRTTIHVGIDGDINTPIQCAGARVSPGDIVIGDDSGVIVIPRLDAPNVLARGLERKKRSEFVRKEIESGKLLPHIMKVDEVLKQRGMI